MNPKILQKKNDLTKMVSKDLQYWIFNSVEISLFISINVKISIKIVALSLNLVKFLIQFTRPFQPSNIKRLFTC